MEQQIDELIKLAYERGREEMKTEILKLLQDEENNTNL